MADPPQTHAPSPPQDLEEPDPALDIGHSGGGADIGWAPNFDPGLGGSANCNAFFECPPRMHAEAENGQCVCK